MLKLKSKIPVLFSKKSTKLQLINQGLLWKREKYSAGNQEHYLNYYLQDKTLDVSNNWGYLKLL